MNCVICFSDGNKDEWKCKICSALVCTICQTIRRRYIDGEVGVDPCIFGAPRCRCVGASCIRRPCQGNNDAKLIAQWEVNEPHNHREWVEAEVLQSIKTARKPDQTLQCPVCRAEENMC